MRKLMGKLLRYGVTGGIAAIVDASVFTLLMNADLNIVVASCLSFCLAAYVNYNLSSRFVFGGRPTLRGFGLFFAAASIGLVVNTSITLMGVSQLALPPFAAKILGSGIALFVNFLLNLRIVFNARP